MRRVSILMNIEHVLLDESIHLLNISVLFVEELGSVDDAFARLRSSLQFAQPLEGAPKTRLQTKRFLVAVDGNFFFELALTY